MNRPSLPEKNKREIKAQDKLGSLANPQEGQVSVHPSTSISVTSRLDSISILLIAYILL
jgi:hypothetical protein